VADAAVDGLIDAWMAGAPRGERDDVREREGGKRRERVREGKREGERRMHGWIEGERLEGREGGSKSEEERER
jgi:hypothetical protein